MKEFFVGLLTLTLLFAIAAGIIFLDNFLKTKNYWPLKDIAIVLLNIIIASFVIRYLGALVLNLRDKIRNTKK